MTLTLTLTPELEARLAHYADASGKPKEAVAAELLATLPEPIATPAATRRVAGLGKGNVLWMSDDFNDPLPDEYWDSPVFPEAMTPESVT